FGFIRRRNGWRRADRESRRVSRCGGLAFDERAGHETETRGNTAHGGAADRDGEPADGVRAGGREDGKRISRAGSKFRRRRRRAEELAADSLPVLLPISEVPPQTGGGIR